MGYTTRVAVDLKSLAEAAKELSTEPDWIRTHRDEFVRLTSPLEIDGLTVGGLRFMATANILVPDRWVTFQVEYSPPGRKSAGGPLIRFDWRPMRPHNNKGLGPPEHRFKSISGSHVHPFDLNGNPAQDQVRKGNLPIAIPLAEEPGNYQEALDFAEKILIVKGVRSLPIPPWSTKLTLE